MELDDQELEATKKMREEKCEFCEEMIFIQQKPEKNYVWIRNPYCPMCGRRLGEKWIE